MDNGKMNYFGGDLAISMAGAKDLDDAIREEGVRVYNKRFEDHQKLINDKIKRELEEGRQAQERADAMEIVPLNNYVLVRPYAENPFEKLEEVGGIIVPKADGSFMNPDTGEEDTEYNCSVQADVIEVGPACKYVKEGDVVYYRRACGVPIPFFRQGFEVVAEPQIHVVINEGIKARFAKLEKKYGK